LRGTEDPHFLEALPSFVLKASRADMLCFAGLELESAWLGKVLSKSGNSKIQAGGSGFCELGSFVEVIEKPLKAPSRADGDVHASGNPHFNLSPLKLKEASRGMLKLLAGLKPELGSEFIRNEKIFSKKMDSLHAEILFQYSESNRKKSINVLEYHKEFTYFIQNYGIRSEGSIEEKPGVPPSAARLLKIAQLATEKKVTVAIGSLYSPSKHLKKFHELSAVPQKQVPAMVNLNKDEWNSIEKVQRALLNAIVTEN
jgi:zinc/manganese transport system substrate-binding protein